MAAPYIEIAAVESLQRRAALVIVYEPGGADHGVEPDGVLVLQAGADGPVGQEEVGSFQGIQVALAVLVHDGLLLGADVRSRAKLRAASPRVATSAVRHARTDGPSHPL